MAAKFNFLFCTFLLVSAFALPNPTQVNGYNLLDILKKIVHAIEDIIDQIVTIATQVVDTIVDNWTDYQEKIITVTRTVIAKALEVVLNPLLDSMAESSTDAGKKLVKCIEDAEADIVEVPVTLLDETTKCMGDDLVTVVKSLGPLVSDLAGVQEKAKAAANKVDDCQGEDIQGLLCVVQVAGDLLQVAAEIPEIVMNDLAPIKDDIEKLIKTAIQCGEDQVAPFYANAGKVLDKIATCAAA